jgi:Uncharacterized conserved protein (DUF2190).
VATNIIFEHGNQIQAACSAPSTPSSGDPVLIGKIPGVALTDENSDGVTTVKLNGVADLPVVGKNASDADTAISVGDILYYDSGVINVDATNGTRFGYALEAVSSGSTSTINVLIGY